MKPLALAPLVALMLAAAASAQIVTEHNRQDALRHYRGGEQALRLEHYNDAEKEFQAAIKLDPFLDLAHYGLGQVYMATKRYTLAVRAFVGCREAFTKAAAQAFQDDAAYERRLDDHIRALEDAKNAYESGVPGARTMNTPVTIQRLNEQINYLKHQRKRGGDQPQGVPAWISIGLGGAYFRTEDMAGAEREYRAALQAEPGLGEGHNNLAVVLMLTGRYDEADQEVKAAEAGGFHVNPQFKADLGRAIARQ